MSTAEAGTHRARRPSIEGAVELMTQDMVAAGRVFPSSQAMCQIQARARAAQPYYSKP